MTLNGRSKCLRLIKKRYPKASKGGPAAQMQSPSCFAQGPGRCYNGHNPLEVGDR